MSLVHIIDRRNGLNQIINLRHLAGYELKGSTFRLLIKNPYINNTSALTFTYLTNEDKLKLMEWGVKVNKAELFDRDVYLHRKIININKGDGNNIKMPITGSIEVHPFDPVTKTFSPVETVTSIQLEIDDIESVLFMTHAPHKAKTVHIFTQDCKIELTANYMIEPMWKFYFNQFIIDTIILNEEG